MINEINLIGEMLTNKPDATGPRISPSRFDYITIEDGKMFFRAKYNPSSIMAVQSGFPEGDFVVNDGLLIYKVEYEGIKLDFCFI
jgi:hypothetical protein